MPMAAPPVRWCADDPRVCSGRPSRGARCTSPPGRPDVRKEEQVSVAEDGPVAVIGLGRIGTGIAHSLLRRGFRVRVYNRTVARAAPLVSAGATLAPTPAQAARGVPVVVSSLLDDASVRAVVEAEQGLMAGMSAGGIHVSTTTCSPG